MTDNEIVTLRDLYKRFSAGKGLLTALRDINLTFGKGEFSGIVGPSGSGKTTLLNIIGSLDTPTEGTATVLVKQTGDLSQKEAAALRNHGIGFIFQTYNLLPVYSIYENVEFALLLQKTPARERKERVMESLQWVGLADRAQSRPATLSGGECQRVAIARSIVKRPALILADEPSANLDSVNTHHILKTMKQLNRELGTTFLFSTHDEKVMQHLDRIIYLKDGSVEKDELC